MTAVRRRRRRHEQDDGLRPETDVASSRASRPNAADLAPAAANVTRTRAGRAQSDRAQNRSGHATAQGEQGRGVAPASSAYWHGVRQTPLSPAQASKQAS